MKKTKRNLRKALIIWLEIATFGLVLATLWLDEFVDLPHLLFNSPPTPYRVEEYLIETALVTIVGVTAVLLTWILMRRLEKAEAFVRVCSWCKRVFLNDGWVNFEEYLHQKQDLIPTHGICENCMQKVKAEIRSNR